MKHLVLSLLLFTNLRSEAQVWCPNGAFWEYNFFTLATEGCETRAYLGDTLLGAFPAQHIDTRTITYNFISAVLDTLYSNTYTREDNNVVYEWVTDEMSTWYWDTLYWFGAEVGDRWYRPGSVIDCFGQAGMVEVLSIETQLIGGIPLQVFNLGQVLEDGTVGPSQYDMIERLGTPLMYLPTYCPLGELAGEIRTYSDNIGGSFNTGDPSTCDLFTSISASFRALSILITANPSNEFVQVFFPELSGTSTLRVNDTHGRTVSKRSVMRPPHVLDTSKWVSGMYIFTLFGSDGRHASTKWMKP